MAQRRRKEQLAKQKQRRSILLCIGGGIGAMLLSLIICIIVFGIPSESEPVSAPVSTLIPYDSNTALFDKRSHQRADESTPRKRAHFRQ